MGSRAVIAAVVLFAFGAEAASFRDGFTATTIVEDLEQPTAAAFTPDGRLLIVEKTGGLRLWTAEAGLREAPLLSLEVCTDSEMGLLGIALDPAFAANGFVYLYYTQPPGGDRGRCFEGVDAGRVNRIARVTLAGDVVAVGSHVVLLDGIRTDGGNHDGGGIRFGPDGMLYAGVGDTGIGDGGPPGASTNPYAADLQHLEGKVLRLAPDGSAPPDNPFFAMGGNAAFVWAYGLRNPFRIAFDPITPGPRHLWLGDVGQVTWEEIDVVRAGDDLGWPGCEGFAPTGPCPGDSVPPVHVYAHPDDPNQGVAVTGGVHYDGTQFTAEYRGDYFFADSGLDEIYRAEVNATRDGIVGQPETFATGVAGPVDLLVGPDGALWVVAIASASILRVTQDGQPGGGPPGCEREVLRAASTSFKRAGKQAAACLDGRREDCLPPNAPKASRGLRKRLGRACDAAAAVRVCARLGCGTCASGDALAACAAGDVAATLGDVASPLASAGRSRCRSAVVKNEGRAAAARLAAALECVETGGTACVPPPSPPAPSAKGLRACRVPAADVCAALACAPCASGDDVASCATAAAADPVDTLGREILGLLR